VTRAKVLTWFTALSAAIFATSAFATPMPQDNSGSAEGAPAAARISYLDGTVFCWGPYDDEKRNLMINDLVREGDELYAAPDTFVEVEFPGGSYLRLDGGSSVVINGYRDDLRIKPSAGAFYMSTGDWTEGIASFGPDLAEVASASVTKLTISPDEARSVAVVYGLARINGKDAAIEVADNQMIASRSYSSAWTSADFYPDEGGDFDLWSMEREDVLRAPPGEDTPSYPLVGYSELQGHGDWVIVDGVWVWRPIHVATDWRPYSTGEWVWYAGYGWTWVSCYGWGYVTSHHGRWHYDPFYGWCWMPGMVWSPAWVTWSVFDGHIGWCAVGWWGWPVVMHAGWYSYWDYRCWVAVHYGYFYHGGYHHHGAYHYHHHHHHSGHAYHRPSGAHGSSSHGSSSASSSNRREGLPSHDRSSLDANASHGRGAGASFRTFERDTFEAMQRSPVKDANHEILRSAAMTPDQRAAFDRGGESRTALLQQHHDFERSDPFSSRSPRGPSGDGGERGTAASRPTFRPDGQGSLTQQKPSSAGDGGRSFSGQGAQDGSSRSISSDHRSSSAPTSSQSVQDRTSGDAAQRSRVQDWSRSWDSSRGVQTAPDSNSSQAPAVPRYSGTSDGQRRYEHPWDSSSSRSSSSQRTYQPSSRSSSSSRSSWSNDNNRSRSSSSTSSSSTRSRSSSSSKKKKKKK